MAFIWRYGSGHRHVHHGGDSSVVIIIAALATATYCGVVVVVLSLCRAAREVDGAPRDRFTR